MVCVVALIDMNRWSHAQDSTYTNWKTLVPYIISGLDNCGVLTADGTWFNFKCTEKRSYVCEAHEGTIVSHAPSVAPTPYLRPTTMPSAGLTSLQPTVTSNPADGNGASLTTPVDEVHIKLHVSYIFIVLGSILFVYVLYRFRKSKLPVPSKMSNSLSGDFEDANSSHNLVEMETRRSYGEDNDNDSVEEIDLGGCFAFSNSSAEEMLASQLNAKIYSTVDSDLNAS